MPSYTRLLGIKDANKDTLAEQLEENLVEFFNYGLLESGAYDDVKIENMGQHDPTAPWQLYPVTMPGIPNGRIWQSPFRNWVWERELESTRQPIVVSGVYVSGTFRKSSDIGPYKHFVNYPQGRVVFETPVPTSSIIHANYSYRWVSFYDQDVPWFRDVIFDAYRFELTDYQPSGIQGLLKQHSVQLPAVVIETPPNRRLVPRQQGDLSQHVFQDFLLHILTENSEDRNFLLDAISLQQDRTFWLFDRNARAAANQFALDWHGTVIPGAKMYPQLVEPHPVGFRWKRCVFNRITGQESSARLPLFRAIVRVTLETDFTEL